MPSVSRTDGGPALHQLSSRFDTMWIADGRFFWLAAAKLSSRVSGME